MGVNND